MRGLVGQHRVQLPPRSLMVAPSQPCGDGLLVQCTDVEATDVDVEATLHLGLSTGFKT